MSLAEITAVLRRELENPSSSFSIGSLGAIAEFHRASDEPLELVDRDRLTVTSARGGLSLKLREETSALTYEMLSRTVGRWQQGVLFCLPKAIATSAGRDTITELGSDEFAIREQDRGAILFDMGLSARNIDFCVRTSDLALIEILRTNSGRSVFDPNNPAMTAILEINPHRIAISALGRCEVYQAIGLEVTPEGPHTHVLPELLATGRTHAANIPVPDGLLPCLSFYPANPLFDALGEAKPYDGAAQRAFDHLVALWASPEHRAEKESVLRDLARGLPPQAHTAPISHALSHALRVTLRQKAAAQGGVERAGKNLKAWLVYFDRAPIPDDDPLI